MDKWREEAARRFPTSAHPFDDSALQRTIDQRLAFERQQLEAWRRDRQAKAKERSRRLRAINPERLSRRGASKFINVAS